MNDAKILLQNSFEKIARAMQEGKWREAYQACNEILRYDSENHEALRLKIKIEKEVKKINHRAVKEDLKVLRSLFQQKNFEELLNQLQKMRSFFVDYPAFAKLYERAQKGYQQKMYRQREDGFSKNIVDIKKMAANGDFAQALKKTQDLQVPNFRDKKIEKLIQQLRTNWIKNELQKNENLLKTDHYEEILLFLQGLKHIDEHSSNLNKLIQKTKKTYQIYKVESKKEFIYQSSEQIRTLYQLKKYEKVIQACKEVLDIDFKNHEIKSFLKRAQNKLRHQIQNEIVVQMLSAQKRYLGEYQNNQAGFKKI